jgi:hypothetical protein
LAAWEASWAAAWALIAAAWAATASSWAEGSTGARAAASIWAIETCAFVSTIVVFSVALICAICADV